MDEEHYKHFVFRTTLFSRLKTEQESCRFVSTPLSGTHLGKPEPYTRYYFPYIYAVLYHFTVISLKLKDPQAPYALM